MKLSTIFEQLNKGLELNLTRSPKKRDYKQQHQNETKSILDSSDHCLVKDMKDFESSDTKLYVSKREIINLLSEILKEKYPNINLYVSHASHSKYTISAHRMKAESIGLDSKYQGEINDFTPITSFNVKQANTIFGEVSHHSHRMGREEDIRMASKLVLEDDINIVEQLREVVKRSYRIQEQRNQAKNEKKNEFEKKLKEFGLTEEQFEELTRLKGEI